MVTCEGVVEEIELGRRARRLTPNRTLGGEVGPAKRKDWGQSESENDEERVIFRTYHSWTIFRKLSSSMTNASLNPGPISSHWT